MGLQAAMFAAMKKTANPVDAYLESVPTPQRATLIKLRKALKAALPTAEETIAYGLPCFKVDGKGVAGFAAFKDHCSYFPMSGTVLQTLEDQVDGYTVSKGALQFPVGKSLPAALLKKLLKTRLEELSQLPAKGSGPYRSYYDNGVLASSGSYKAGKMHGKWEFFRRDGTVMRTGAFKAGEQSGSWKTWDQKGRMVKETVFKG